MRLISPRLQNIQHGNIILHPEPGEQPLRAKPAPPRQDALKPELHPRKQQASVSPVVQEPNPQGKGHLHLMEPNPIPSLIITLGVDIDIQGQQRPVETPASAQVPQLPQTDRH